VEAMMRYLIVIPALILVLNSGLATGCEPAAFDEETLILQFWQEVQEYRARKRTEQLAADDKLLAGTMNAQVWLYEKERNVRQIAEFPQILRTTRKQYEGVPVSKEEITAYREETGAYPLHPKDELVNLLLSIKVEAQDYRFREGASWESDWGRFFRLRRAVVDGLQEPMRSEFMAEWSAYETPLGMLLQETGAKYIIAYQNAPFALLTIFPDEQVDLIKRYYSSASPRERETMDKSGIVRAFDKQLDNTLMNLRLLSPELDAWLHFWGFSIEPFTQEGREAYVSICREHDKVP